MPADLIALQTHSLSVESRGHRAAPLRAPADDRVLPIWVDPLGTAATSLAPPFMPGAIGYWEQLPAGGDLRWLLPAPERRERVVRQAGSHKKMLDDESGLEGAA